VLSPAQNQLQISPLNQQIKTITKRKTMKAQLMQRCVLTSTCLFITALAPAVLGQGALTPPGAPAPTMKTLTQVEPRKDVFTLPPGPTSLYLITAPGSYYLTTNLVSPGGKDGISVMADHVTIDLRGFAIIGTGNMGMNFNAISVPNPQVDLMVMNGTIASWSGEGVFAPMTRNSKLLDLRVFNIGRSALDIGDGSIVNDCLVYTNGYYSYGSPAIKAGNNCTVESCVAQNNAGPGISTGNGGLVTDCTANYNNCYGINTGDNSRVNNCNASVNWGNNPGDGIFVGYGSTVSGCTASGNANDGINTICGGSVLGCVAWTNQDDGIVVQYGSTVKDCTASGNRWNGIVISITSQAIGNTCDFNKHNGIYVGLSGYGNRIDGNSLTTNTIAGIDCSGSTGDLVVRNNAHANGTDYSLNPATQNAMIYVSPGPNFVITDPWANFSH
jgi:hypothetical protein